MARLFSARFVLFCIIFLILFVTIDASYAATYNLSNSTFKTKIEDDNFLRKPKKSFHYVSPGREFETYSLTGVQNFINSEGEQEESPLTMHITIMNPKKMNFHVLCSESIVRPNYDENGLPVVRYDKDLDRYIWDVDYDSYSKMTPENNIVLNKLVSMFPFFTKSSVNNAYSVFDSIGAKQIDGTGLSYRTISYVVQKGDTFENISSRFYGNSSKANDILTNNRKVIKKYRALRWRMVRPLYIRKNIKLKKANKKIRKYNRKIKKQNKKIRVYNRQLRSYKRKSAKLNSLRDYLIKHLKQQNVSKFYQLTGKYTVKKYIRYKKLKKYINKREYIKSLLKGENCGYKSYKKGKKLYKLYTKKRYIKRRSLVSGMQLILYNIKDDIFTEKNPITPVIVLNPGFSDTVSNKMADEVDNTVSNTMDNMPTEKSSDDKTNNDSNSGPAEDKTFTSMSLVSVVDIVYEEAIEQIVNTITQHAYVGINANYFWSTGYTEACVNDPIGIIVKDGKRITSSIPEACANYFALDNKNKPYVGSDIDSFNDLYNSKNIMSAVSGSRLLIKDSEIVNSANSDGPVTSRNPKTGVGYMNNGYIVFISVDGRAVADDTASDTVWKDGCTSYELATQFKALGAVGAVELDGGGSTQHVIGRPGIGSLNLVRERGTETNRLVPVIFYAKTNGKY